MAVPGKIGRYEIIEELGHGAMGAVYRAKDPAMGRVVALKTILSVALASTQESEFRERFYREARAAGGLAHPGIVPIFDVGEQEGMPFLVMEFISGRTLDDLMKKGERFTIERACEIGQRIAEALGYAHQHGVIHRDIKPANILLTSRETYGIERPKIADFGVAKMAEGSTTMTGQLLGTPAFMPPEQFTGGPIDGRADIFSLGVVLYWMATGEQPFPGESLTAVSYKVVHTEPIPPRKLNPWLPMELDNVIMKCLAKSPEERYQTAEELAQHLGRVRDQVKGGSKVTPVALVDPNAPTVMGTGAGTAVQPALATQPVPAPIQTQQVAPPTAVANPAPKPSKFNTWVAAAAITIVVLAAGGWYAMRLRAKAIASVPPPTPTVTSSAPTSTDVTVPPAVPVESPATSDKAADSAAPASTPVAPAVPAVSKTDNPSTNVKGPASTAKKPSPAITSTPAAASTKPGDNKTVAKANAAPAPTPSAASPATAAAPEFDPKSLDPKTSGRLKLDWRHMPAGVQFVVEMNGKHYYQRTGAGGSASDDDLLVPPGVQEFRVIATSGDVKRNSNTVSAEFKAKKRLTMRIELRIPGVNPGQAVPQGLYGDTQIVVALK